MASIHFSQSLSTRGEATPASSRAVQLPAMYPVSPDEPEERAQGEASPRASADLGSSWLDLEKAETQDGFYLHPDASSSPASSISDEESETRSYLASLPTSSRSEYSALPPSQADNARYYDHALSKGDHDALIMGELNHNLRAYTPRDLVIHHESRKELVPQGIAGTDKLGEMEAFAKIEQEKQHSHQVQERNLPSAHRHNLSATFDSFLVPHKSGKGEAFRGTPTAKKPKAIKEKRSSSSMQPVTNTLRRLSMMPSMHSLKICKSRASLRKDSLENSDVSPLPELPEHVSYAQR
ncbi:hypothetical protein SNOG_15593 [Parastagonospora nodorum SN15]|uniref:Uncharacterized protein n=1 Tax=Phaeosphaeria nodorum (strain SN15 / ATCC MYA-4574 / FGSC 10173) TaxID=321614 RepID=Q0TXW3_PHANO|nr:hypothetical protein SNOG_15593 [Parastagonospora nodorum SN15]EAT76968.2 hypothetical protein SNOG_15593 [Parastagonospora nodorum SN15]